MTTAVLLAVRPTPAGSVLPRSPLPRLIDQLEAGGVRTIVIIARPERAATLHADVLNAEGTARHADGGAGRHADRGAGRHAASGAALQTATGALVVRESPDAARDLAELAALCQAAGEDGTPLIIADADLVAHDSILSGALAGAAGGATALTARLVSDANEATGPDTSASHHRLPPVRVDRGRVISAGSSVHRVGAPTASFAGVITLGTVPARRAAGALAAAGRSTIVASARGADALALALVALVRAGIPVRVKTTAPLFCAPVTVPEELARAERQLATVDEDAARMRSAIKADDDLFATYAVSSWSPHLVRLAARLGLRPTLITWLSMVVALIAALGFANGGRVTAVAGAGLLYLSFVLDCTDGQLARYTQRFSRFGGWLDTLADRGKEYAVYAGLAVGATSSVVNGDAASGADVWPLAIAMITLQTARHMTDCWYGYARDQAVARLAPAPFDQVFDINGGAEAGNAGPGPGVVRGAGGLVQALVQATNSGRRSLLHWIKKLVVFPIGERWLVIALGAALFDARTVFLALLSFGALAAVYTVAVRILRSRAVRPPSMSSVDVTLHRDDGPLARLIGGLGARWGVRVPPLASAGLAAAAGLAVTATAVAGELGAAVPSVVRTAALVLAGPCLVIAALAGRGRHEGPLDWFVPGALRAAELTTVIGLAVWQGVPLPLLFGMLGVLALFHYDLAARLEKVASPLASRVFGLGWDGRLLVLAVAVAFGHATFGFALLAAYLVVVFAVGVAVGLRRDRPIAPGAPVLPPRQRAKDSMADATPS